ncbi:hypothetical protein ACIQLJ_14520 [Microbacterium sp. NPDC091313]
MILWFTLVQVGVASVVAVVAIIAGLVGRPPGDVTVGGLALIEVLLVAQIVSAVVSPLAGNAPSGSGLEYWTYLVSAALLPPAGVVWALLERSRWSTVIMGVAAMAVAIMVWRMHVIWTVQTA